MAEEKKNTGKPKTSMFALVQAGKGYLYSLLLLVVCDWWIWGLSVLVGHVWG